MQIQCKSFYRISFYTNKRAAMLLTRQSADKTGQRNAILCCSTLIKHIFRLKEMECIDSFEAKCKFNGCRMAQLVSAKPVALGRLSEPVNHTHLTGFERCSSAGYVSSFRPRSFTVAPLFH